MKTFALILLLPLSVIGADPKYPVSQIREDLKKGVHAVIRNDESRFTIVARNQTIFSHAEAVTILDEKGNDHAIVRLDYDKNRTILYLEARVYDAMGKQIKTLRKGDIYDRSLIDNNTLFSDDRIKLADLTQSVYPYTIEIQYEVSQNYLYSIPTMYFGGLEESVEKSSFELVFPAALEPRVKLVKLDLTAEQMALDGGRKMLRWSMTNLLPFDHKDLVPRIMAAPSQFEYGGYSGNMSTWQSYGQWNIELLKGRDELPESTRKLVAGLVANLHSPEEKVKALYEYMQSKTRYVNIAEGIGGLQPFPASTVDANGYGDCKALSNYMLSLLKVAGIKGYYTRIRAGDDAEEIKSDFPSHQTNHVIVSVPLQKDTIWLECTSSLSPFNYLGSFTNNRYAIMITETGGKLVRTPNMRDNIESRKAEVYLDLQGNAVAKASTSYKGLNYDDVISVIYASSEDQKKWLQRNINIASYDINSFTISNAKAKVPVATINCELILNRLASVSGKRLFVTPNLLGRFNYVPDAKRSAKIPITVNQELVEYDTIRYHLPEGIYPESVPAAVHLTNRFGEYDAQYQLNQGSLIYIRKLKLNQGVFPAETYTELAEFFRNISKTDKQKLAFISKT